MAGKDGRWGRRRQSPYASRSGSAGVNRLAGQLPVSRNGSYNLPVCQRTRVPMSEEMLNQYLQSRQRWDRSQARFRSLRMYGSYRPDAIGTLSATRTPHSLTDERSSSRTRMPMTRGYRQVPYTTPRTFPYDSPTPEVYSSPSRGGSPRPRPSPKTGPSRYVQPNISFVPSSPSTGSDYDPRTPSGGCTVSLPTSMVISPTSSLTAEVVRAQSPNLLATEEITQSVSNRRSYSSLQSRPQWDFGSSGYGEGTGYGLG